LEIEAARLDKLNHYRAAFEMSKTSAGLEIDAEYYGRFAALVGSFDNLPDDLQADKAMLVEAGRNGDAQRIRETLPAFCESLAAMHRSKADSGGTENEIVRLLFQRLKKAIRDGDAAASKKTVAELGAKSLSPRERELYLKLYDLRMVGNTEKALEALESYAGG
jgi:hypothetical protein